MVEPFCIQTSAKRVVMIHCPVFKNAAKGQKGIRWTQASIQMRMKNRSDAPIILNGKVVAEVKVLAYLSSKVTTDGGT